MTRDELIEEFRNRFQQEPSAIFFCPGRVNLIGEHIDYNGGQVLPCAISQGTWLAVARNADKRLSFHSLRFPETATLHLQSSYSRTGSQWFNYPLGIIHELLQQDHNLSGLDLLFDGDLPVGAGLSSSASIEVVTAFALSSIYGLDINRKDIALLSKKVENEFIGVSCGIMDQFAVTMGKKQQAILLDCDTLDFEYIPFDIPDYSLVIINSKKERTLADSKYNERFAESAIALSELKKVLPLENLCGLDPASFEIHQHLISDPVIRKRALHVVSENARVNDTVIALQTKDWEVFGKLLYASHRSLKELYEVSCTELDTIVDFCKDYPGCAGARMTGAGFGGCAIALVKKISFDDFASKLNKQYKKTVGYEPGIFVTTIGEGVTKFS
ncbi:MAG: galactokinase [Chitinophagaceae bacterium]